MAETKSKMAVISLEILRRWKSLAQKSRIAEMNDQKYKIAKITWSEIQKCRCQIKDGGNHSRKCMEMRTTWSEIQNGRNHMIKNKKCRESTKIKKLWSEIKNGRWMTSKFHEGQMSVCMSLHVCAWLCVSARSWRHHRRPSQGLPYPQFHLSLVLALAS